MSNKEKSPLEVQWERLGLNDNGKLLLMLYSSTDSQAEGINQGDLSLFMFILNKENLVPHWYTFKFSPHPSSNLIKRDLISLGGSEKNKS